MTDKDKVKDILRKIKGDWFENEENLITDGYIGSFELIKFIKEIENAFDVKIPLDKISPSLFNSIESIELMIRDLK